MSRRTLPAVVAVTTLLVVGVAVVSVDWPGGPPAGPAELIAFLAVGVAFVTAGVVAWQSRPDDNTGRLMVLAGLLWLVKGGAAARNPVVFTVGAALTVMYLPVLIHVLLGFPTGRLTRRWERWFVGGCYVYFLASVLLDLMFYNPSVMIGTDRFTAPNLLLVRDDPTIFAALQLVFGAVAIGISVVVIGVLLARWRSGSPAYRAAFAPLWIAGILGFATVIGTGLVTARSSGVGNVWTAYVGYLATALFPIAVLVGLWRYRVARGAVSDVMVEVGAAPLGEEFVHALRKALRDPGLVLWSWSPRSNSYLDAHGDPQRLPGGGDPRAATVLERDGVPVGALVYDRSLRHQPQLLAAVRSAATLALDNQRLQFELQAQLAEVRRSRERIVAAGDAQRRRLERNLHDGAQQRLVAATILLRRAQRTSQPERKQELLTEGTAELDSALVELRELARGVYPPVLQEHGLAAALTALAERAPLPVEIVDTLTGRAPASIELAAYFIAAEAVANATKHSGATHIEIDLRRDGGMLRMVVTDDGCGGATLTAGGGLSGLSDRAAALGGVLGVHSPPGGGTTLTLSLPLTAGTSGEPS
ncbi:hypothetical protein Rruber_01451 [Rhodococcus ruber]|uniref:sensor histidine kinase n=1 Tax=Rhodococcus ruber TaxID=1830 RepID=UPI00315D5688